MMSYFLMSCFLWKATRQWLVSLEIVCFITWSSGDQVVLLDFDIFSVTPDSILWVCLMAPPSVYRKNLSFKNLYLVWPVASGGRLLHGLGYEQDNTANLQKRVGKHKILVKVLQRLQIRNALAVRTNLWVVTVPCRSLKKHHDILT